MIFEKENADSIIYWVDPEDDNEGAILFSFDGKTVLNFWTDYPDKLTDGQIKAFQKENPILAALKPVKLPRKRP